MNIRPIIARDIRVSLAEYERQLRLEKGTLANRRHNTMHFGYDARTTREVDAALAQRNSKHAAD